EAGASSPLRLSADEFNAAAEAYYRDTLRRRHLAEGLDLLRGDVRRLDEPGASAFLDAVAPDVLAGTAGGHALARLIHLPLRTILADGASVGTDSDGLRA